MLKTVIQKKNVNRLLRFKPAARGEAIFADAERNAALKAAFHQFDFVTCSVCTAVAAAKNRDALPFREKLLSEPDHRGCLAGAADGKIAHADDRSFQPLLLQPAVRVEPNPHADNDTIQHGQRPKKRPQKRRNVHRPTPSRCLAISAATRSVAPRESATNWRAVSLIFFMRSGSRNNS